MKWLLAITLLAVVLGAARAEECSCAAVRLDFRITCDDDDYLIDALDALYASSCSSVCSSTDCQRNFYIIQSAHDYCAEDDVRT